MVVLALHMPFTSWRVGECQHYVFQHDWASQQHVRMYVKFVRIPRMRAGMQVRGQEQQCGHVLMYIRQAVCFGVTVMLTNIVVL